MYCSFQLHCLTTDGNLAMCHSSDQPSAIYIKQENKEGKLIYMYGWMDGWMDRWTDGWMNGWMKD